MSELDRILDRFSKRCPKCKGVNFTSDNHRHHRCLDCDERFTDATALPSIAREEGIAMLPAESRKVK